MQTTLWWLPIAGMLARAADVVYVTDLTLYTQLAPCAQSAIRYEVMKMTSSLCPEAVTDLQSCVCSQSNYFSSLFTGISSSVSYSCGSTASADQSSAATVYSAYCNQDNIPTFSSPSISVLQYITDIPEISYLGKCISSQLSMVVMGLTDTECPPGAGALATCACSKNQNSLVVSQSINTQVTGLCNSFTDDLSSAHAFFSGYCNLNKGTSSFATPTNPPGDMSYYVTDLPAFSKMPACAKSALSSAVFTNTYSNCPGGPQLLASCVCLKPSMSTIVSSYITSNIRWDCSSDPANLSSALEVYNYYCSAANNKLVATGVSVSVLQTKPAGQTSTGTSPKETGTTTGRSSSSSSSGSSGGSTTGGSSSGNSSGTSSDSSSKSNTGVIVGAVVGVVVGLALIAAAAFFTWRHVQRNKKLKDAQHFQQLDNLSPDGFMGGKSELPATAAAGGIVGGVAAATSPSPSMQKHGYYNNNSNLVSPQSPAGHNISPVSAHHQGYVPPPNAPELQGQMYSPNGPYPPPSSHVELQGQQSFPHQLPQQAELYGQSPSGVTPQQPVYQADSRPVPAPAPAPVPSPSPSHPTAPGMSWQSGPVSNSYTELDGSHGGQPR